LLMPALLLKLSRAGHAGSGPGMELLGLKRLKAGKLAR